MRHPIEIAAGIVLVAALLSACGSIIASPYSAQQIACVEDAGTRAEADACRCRVRAKFGNPCDGGAP